MNGHYERACNLKTNALVKRTQPTYCLNAKRKHVKTVSSYTHPDYEHYTYYGHINNLDGSKVPIKILRDSGSLVSLLTEDYAKKCDCFSLTESCLIKGITPEIISIPIIEVDISSGIVNGNIKFGVTNGIPMGFDCLVGNDIAKSNSSNPFDDIFVVTRAKARALTRALTTPTFNSNSKTDLSTDLTESANSKSNVQLITDIVTDHLTNKVDTVIDCDSNNPFDSTISTVDSTVDRSIDSVNKVNEVSTDVVTVNHDAEDDANHLNDEVNDSSLNCKVDVIDGQDLNSTYDQETDEIEQCNLSGISELFVEPKQITWNDMLRLYNETLSKWQHQCADLKQIFEMAYQNKQTNKHNHYFIADGILMHSMKKGLSDLIQIVVPKCLRKRILIVSDEAGMAGHLVSKKTLNRFIKFFFWRSIVKDVNYFGKTCQVFQLFGKGPNPLKPPLISLPIETDHSKP